jgi:hypothetical protein
MSLKQAILSLAFRPSELMQKSEICASSVCRARR